METIDTIKVEPQVDIINASKQKPSTTNDSHTTAGSPASVLDEEEFDDPLEPEMPIGILKTNTAKYAFAQQVCKEVMRRVPILSPKTSKIVTENSEEEKKIMDKLRIRMMRIKNRILNDIKLPLEEAEVAKQKAKDKRFHKYKKMIEKETPEEAAERRKREAEAKSYHRNIKKELETPEMLIERKVERIKKRLERKANETPEERNARREQTRNYRQMLKERRPQKNRESESSTMMICAKTGIIYDKSTRKGRRKRKNIDAANNQQSDNLLENIGGGLPVSEISEG